MSLGAAETYETLGGHGRGVKALAFDPTVRGARGERGGGDVVLARATDVVGF